MSSTEPPARAVIVLGPALDAVSGVSSHICVLLGSSLARRYEIVHFQVGSQGRSASPQARLMRMLSSPFGLAAAVRRHSAAIVHVNTSLVARAFWRDLVYVLVAKLCGARIVYQVHGGALPHDFAGSGRFAQAALRTAFRLPDAIVVLARVEAAAYRRFMPQQPVLRIPNAVDCRPFFGAGLARSPADAPLRLVYLGHLSAAKGLYELLDGFAEARRNGVAVHLTIAGTGPEEARLRAAAHGLGSDVSFVGRVAGLEKTRLLGRSDAFVLPSYSEGLPYSLLEAMAAGAAVIVTPVGGIPDVVADGVHGRFVPVRDARALAAAIAELASDRQSLARMRTACRHRIAKAHSSERLGAAFDALYETLSAVPRTPAIAVDRDAMGG